MGNAQDPAENTMLTEEQEKPPSCFQRFLSCSFTLFCVVFGKSNLIYLNQFFFKELRLESDLAYHLVTWELFSSSLSLDLCIAAAGGLILIQLACTKKEALKRRQKPSEIVFLDFDSDLSTIFTMHMFDL
jgi:hypothetical protein